MHLFSKPQAVPCPLCHRWFKPGNEMCAVLHEGNGCCHHGDTEVLTTMGISITAPAEGTYIGDPPPGTGWTPGTAPRSISLPPLDITFPPPPVPVGWECPRCHRIYAPATLRCEPCCLAAEAAGE
jgi:hypothetical protein